ncbi:hypothetical protein QTN25_001341 [Entamoeba marina]
MEKDYWVAPLSEKNKKVSQTLFLSFRNILTTLYELCDIESADKSGCEPVRIREIGLSVKLCYILSHIQETTKQIVIVVLSSIFNLLVDEEMIQEFLFFGAEKQITNLKSLDSEFITQMISAMVNKLQQPDKIEINNLHTTVNAVAENKTFSENDIDCFRTNH